MKDGEERRIAANLVYVYESGDPSVGIIGGFAIAGIEVEGQLIALEDEEVLRTYPGGEPKKWRTYAVDPQDAIKLSQIAEDLSVEAHYADPRPEG